MKILVKKNYENWKKGNKNKPPPEPNMTVLEKDNSFYFNI
jgi:hypothetical protein